MNIPELQNKLNKQGLDFWKTHSYQNALIILNKLREFWGNDFSLYNNKALLTGEKQLISYLGRNNLNIENINDKINYGFLIQDFANYWNNEAKKFIENQKRLDALIQTSLFEKIISAAGNISSILSSPLFLFAIVGIISLYSIKK